MNKKLIILRGLPGSGKSSRARRLLQQFSRIEICSADDFFVDATGKYNFDRAKLSLAHDMCRARAFRAMWDGVPVVVVDNVNQRHSHMAPYINVAVVRGYEIKVIDHFDGGLSDAELAARNAHGVPREEITRMREGWEPLLLEENQMAA